MNIALRFTAIAPFRSFPVNIGSRTDGILCIHIKNIAYSRNLNPQVFLFQKVLITGILRIYSRLFLQVIHVLRGCKSECLHQLRPSDSIPDDTDPDDLCIGGGWVVRCCIALKTEHFGRMAAGILHFFLLVHAIGHRTQNRYCYHGLEYIAASLRNFFFGELFVFFLYLVMFFAHKKSLKCFVLPQ